MNKRLLAVILVLIAVVALGLVVWFVFLPAFRQTPKVPATTPPSTQTPPPSQPIPAPNVPPPTQEEVQESALQDALRRFAMDASSRAGSYSSVDNYASLRAAMLDATPARQTAIQEQIQALSAAHPPTGPSWGVTTKSLSAKIESGLPIKSSFLTVVSVQAQQVETSSGQASAPAFVTVRLTLVKQDNQWKVSNVTSSPLELK